MAGDWIKMRVSLPQDPKIITIAEFLEGNKEFSERYSNVTVQNRNVTVSLCVTALLVIWGMAREKGDREEDDLVLKSCTLNTLSSICGIPAFGNAMSLVKWAKEEPNHILRMPRFFAEHESPDEKFKRQNAERQARFRERKSRNESNVTITHREEKSSTSSRARKKRASIGNGNDDTEAVKAARRSTWESYSTAYFNRYSTEPLRNAQTNALIANFCKAVPMDEAPAIAAFYVAHNKYSYTNSKHDLKIMLASASALHTDWKTGQQTTETQSRRLDQGQAQGSVWAKLKAEGEKKLL